MCAVVGVEAVGIGRGYAYIVTYGRAKSRSKHSEGRRSCDRENSRWGGV